MDYLEEDEFVPPAEPKEAFRTPEMFRDYMQIMNDLDEETPPCANFPDAYYPELKEDGYRNIIDGAKAMCQECPALLACRVYGLKWEEFGMWGGMTAFERTKARGRLSWKDSRNKA